MTPTSELARLRAEVDHLRGELEVERHAARHDPLTGVLNRRGCGEAIAHLEPGCARVVVASA